MLLYSMIFVWILAENHMDGGNNFLPSRFNISMYILLSLDKLLHECSYIP